MWVISIKLFQKRVTRQSSEQRIWSKRGKSSEILSHDSIAALKILVALLTLNNPLEYLLYFLQLLKSLLHNLERTNSLVMLFFFHHSMNRANVNQRCLDANIFWSTCPRLLTNDSDENVRNIESTQSYGAQSFWDTAWSRTRSASLFVKLSVFSLTLHKTSWTVYFLVGGWAMLDK